MIPVPAQRASARFVVIAILALVSSALAMVAPQAHASVFYDLNVVARSGVGGFVSFGNGPSINDKGIAAFVGRVAGGETVFTYAPVAGVTNIAPGFVSSNRSFGESVQINDRDEVGTWNRRLTAQTIYEMRVFRSATPDDSTVMVRAFAGNSPYELLYPFPTINNVASLEDNSAPGGNLDGVCQGAERCVPQTAVSTFNNASGIVRTLTTIDKVPQSSFDSGSFNSVNFNGTIARPMMSDNARVVVRGRNPGDPIFLSDDYSLTPLVQIANASMGFNALGNAPGIVDDGNIVAFAGNRGNGDGIFLSMETPSGRKTFRIVGENAVITKPELGFDPTFGKIYIQTIDLDSRVGIIYTPDSQGAARGAIVVSFIGTPNIASRSVPSTGKPFAFSAQKGLWTMRIELTALRHRDTCAVSSTGFVKPPGTPNLPFPGGDDVTSLADQTIKPGPNGVCETENAFNHEVLFARTSPVPVLQLFDIVRVGASTFTISDLAVHDPLAAATHDGTLVARSMRRGDHRVVLWAAAGADQLIIVGEHLDSDQDGLMDHWETKGIDMDGDGFIDLDLAALGADPNKRDLFVQVDWTADRTQPLNPQRLHEPQPGLMNKLVQFMAAAPARPDGIAAGIKLHIDAGPGKDKALQPWSRNMGGGPLHGGNVLSVGGQAIDLLYYGLPGSVNFTGVVAQSFDTIKTNHFWSNQKAAREVAFHYLALADHHHVVDFTGNDQNANPVIGTVTAATSTTVTDNATNAFSAFPGGNGIKITAGTGAGQLRYVTSTSGNTATINEPWAVVPDTSSTYILLHGSGGEAKTLTRYDGSFGAAKNVQIDLSAFPPQISGPYSFQGSFLENWRSILHELGHSLSLKHGGVTHNAYTPGFFSIMSYAYLSCQNGVPVNESGGALAGSPPCPVNTYAVASDPVHFDWGRLDQTALDFRDVGNAYSAKATPPNAPPPLEISGVERQRFYGPFDTQSPVVAIAAPASATVIASGAGLTVTFAASDGTGVASAEAMFDVNGDGVVDATSERFAATSTGGGGFSVSVPAVSGPNGSRSLTIFAYDPTGNPGFDAIIVNVGAVGTASVPNVVGQTQAAAASAINAAGFVVGTTTMQSSSTVAAGSVISQTPASGASVATGTAVDLVISSGAAGTVSVPNVVGQTQAAATSAINAAGLAVGTTTTQSSSTVPSGSVISQTPAGGTSVASGSAVNLVVSSGPGSGSATVPNVVGQTQVAATSAITSAGLVLGATTNQASSTVPSGSVISQTPAGGSSVAPGAAVNLVVSNGVAAITTVSGSTPTGTGAISVTVSGGGASCGFTQSSFPPLIGGAGSPPAGSAPAGVAFPHGLFAFTLGPGCISGGVVTLTVSYPQLIPLHAQYWKYGPTAGNAAPHWYTIPVAINGTQVTITIADGGLGDDDLVANGVIVDQGGIGVGPVSTAVAAVEIPTLRDGMLWLLTLMLAAIAWRHRARSQRGRVRD